MNEHCPNCSMRTAHHSPETKRNLEVRLNRIAGQIHGISKMIQEDVYCDDILNQITSIEAALNGVKKMLLEAHIKSCVVERISQGETEVVDELMKTLSRMLR